MADQLMDETTKQIILSAEPGLVISGAGLSVASGLPTFRGAGGLYADEPPPFLEYNYFLQHPEESWDGFIKLHDDLSSEVKPNKAHEAIVRLEEMGIIGFIITQNIDGFQQEAGSRNVIELHGSYSRVRCIECRHAIELKDYDELKNPNLRRCKQCSGLCKPDVTLFNEQIDESIVNASMSALHCCGFIVLIGTSAQVYPARHFIEMAKAARKPVININLESSGSLADYEILGKCEEILPQLVEEFQA